MSYVLDSWALMAWLNGKNPARQYVRRLLERATQGHVDLWMNMINIGEIYYLLVKRGRLEWAERFVNEITVSLPIKMVVPDRDAILGAARIKGQYTLSYADAFAAITAMSLRAALVTGDPEFRQVSGLKIRWIGPGEN